MSTESTSSVAPGQRLTPGSNPLPNAPGTFATTHWSVVASASDPSAAESHAALTRLCESYWYPLYVYVRRRGYSASDAQDLTQEFFTRLLARNWIARADPAKGRFRSFLLSAMKAFLADEWDRARAQKRGGGQPLLPLELERAEQRFVVEPADSLTPDVIFDRRWAQTLLDTVFHRLQAEYESAGKRGLFEELKSCLAQRGIAIPYSELAARLDLSEGALRVSVHRLRQRYRELLRLEIARTVLDPSEVEQELQYLLQIIAA